jgi:hypothetical protein
MTSIRSTLAKIVFFLRKTAHPESSTEQFKDNPYSLELRAKDSSEYLLLSVYKNYIHVETLPDRSGPHLCAAYAGTHTFFRKLIRPSTKGPDLGQ